MHLCSLYDIDSKETNGKLHHPEASACQDCMLLQTHIEAYHVLQSARFVIAADFKGESD